jgi:hypothetical protein
MVPLTFWFSLGSKCFIFRIFLQIPSVISVLKELIHFNNSITWCIAGCQMSRRVLGSTHYCHLLLLVMIRYLPYGPPQIQTMVSTGTCCHATVRAWGPACLYSFANNSQLLEIMLRWLFIIRKPGQKQSTSVDQVTWDIHEKLFQHYDNFDHSRNWHTGTNYVVRPQSKLAAKGLKVRFRWIRNWVIFVVSLFPQEKGINIHVWGHLCKLSLFFIE